MQSANATTTLPPSQQGAVSHQPRPQGALVPARVAAMPIEPPDPKEVEDKLRFRSAAQYKKAVQLAERYLWQARLAVDRRIGSVKKAERQAKLDHEETGGNYLRQVEQAKARHKLLLEQCHSRHRQTMYQSRVGATQAEEVYKAALANLPGYGELKLRFMALHDARMVTQSLVSAYRSSLGPDGMGDLSIFLVALDRTLDAARDRAMTVPIKFAESLLKAVVQRQVRQVAADKSEVERLKQIGGARLLALQAFIAEQHPDRTPTVVRTAYVKVHEWLGKATGSPFDVALDRLRLDVEGIVRREQQLLEKQMDAAAPHVEGLHLLRPVVESYERAQRELVSSDHAAKGVLQVELARVDATLEREIQLADAMVVGMDHTAQRRSHEAKRAVVTSKKLARRWARVLDELQEIGGWQKFVWRLRENFDHESFWLDLRTRLMNRLPAP